MGVEGKFLVVETNNRETREILITTSLGNFSKLFICYILFFLLILQSVFKYKVNKMFQFQKISFFTNENFFMSEIFTFYCCVRIQCNMKKIVLIFTNNLTSTIINNIIVFTILFKCKINLLNLEKLK